MPRRTGLAKTAAWVWTALIVLACWLPSRSLPIDESRGLQIPIPDLDKLIHATMFAGFGYFWMQNGRAMRGRALAVLGAGLALAIVTEIGQATEFVGRDASPFDVLADVAGLGLVVGGVRYRVASQERPGCVSQNQQIQQDR